MLMVTRDGSRFDTSMSAAQVNPKKENVLTSIQKEHFTPPENDGKDSLVALGLGMCSHSSLASEKTN